VGWANYSENINWQLQSLRQDRGSRVFFRGVEYRVSTESVAGAQVGQQALPVESVGPLIAAADPRIFRFSPAFFRPVTEIDPPQENEEILWHNLRYRITRVNYDDESTDTHAINCYAYRMVV
jgi:hypothetical protein